MGGYCGKTLSVNLAAGTVKDDPAPASDHRAFIGGAGLAAKVYFDRFKPKVGALAPDNPLIVFAGPLTGTKTPGASRFAVAARSPLTRLWGEGTCGGDFGPELKFAGYDGIVFDGKANAPCYLLFAGGKVEVRDAADLWGKETFETMEILGKRHGNGRRAQTMVIGPAGERLVRFAAISGGPHDLVGRTGMGAVMGSKNVKAIVCVAKGATAIADPGKYKAVKATGVKKTTESMVAQSLRLMGTDAGMSLGMMTGDVPIQNWNIGEDHPLADALGGPRMTEDYLTDRHACFACPISCRRETEVKDGPHKTARGAGPEYEACTTLGTMIQVADLAAVIRANDLANRLCMDVISLGATIAFAYDCFAHGILTKADCDGLELKWGDPAPAIELVRKIAYREGVGDLLAEGSREVARRLGRGAGDLAVEVKGLEVPMHDPRGFHGMGLAYATSNRGACHLAHSVHPIEQGMINMSDAGFEADYVGQTSEGKAKLVVLGENFGIPMNSLVMCHFDSWCYSADDLLGFLNSVTGFDYSLAEYMDVGARTWMIKRTLNFLWGATRADDRLPKKIMTPVSDGAAAGSVPDMDLMLREYYELRGINADGRPSRAALTKLGLALAADALQSP
ncbi:MAG: aldehyde ferredoxin oxidoreductase family protein [Deltaproteobacteria bacterium]|nr:aldehyde ferredoxin oxidoreductase family protein [Deltaproteobacteria bacterium]